MYHCPECGDMVLAGCPHPDYSIIQTEEEVASRKADDEALRPGTLVEDDGDDDVGF